MGRHASRAHRAPTRGASPRATHLRRALRSVIIISLIVLARLRSGIVSGGPGRRRPGARRPPSGWRGTGRDGTSRYRRIDRPAMLTSTAVLGKATIPGREQSVPQARAFVDSILGPGHPRADVARLLVSELVTNAVQHTHSRH